MVNIKRLIWVLALLPIPYLVAQFFLDGLGANPIQAITRILGDWALRFLLLTLAITPLRKTFGWGRLAALRRSFGLITFTYACLHLISYVGLDIQFEGMTLLKDLLKRRYITFGMISFALLVPLALTSTNGMIRRLGGARWTALHKLVYLVLPLVIVHFTLMIRAGYNRPVIYGMIGAVLLASRLKPASRRVKQEGV
jgi:methionine sulfoxide reductase heme-binding subunit